MADRGVLSVDSVDSAGLESVVAMVNEGLAKEGLGGEGSRVEWRGEEEGR